MQGDTKKNYITIPIGMGWNTSIEFAERENVNVIKWRGIFYAKNKMGEWKMANYDEVNDKFYD